LIGVQLSRSFAIELGYRHLYVDYENDGFVYKADTSGPIIGERFTF
jgi:hypothetical protein